jgi:hypothetical protein
MKQIYLLVLALVVSFTATAQCNYQLVLQDNFGSGFVSPAGVSVSINGTSTFYTVLAAGTAPNVETYPIAIATGDVLIFDYTAPSFTGDMQWSLIDSEGFVLFNSGFNPDSAADFTGTGSCPTCPAVINAAASNIAASTAELAWTRVGTETEWEIEYGPAPYTAGSGGVIVSAVVTNPFTITGLAANTAYDFCVRSVCAPGDLGRNSCGTFTTTPSCPAPGAYTPFNISANEVQFTWDANGNAATNYEIEYALPGVITAPGTNQGTTSLGASAPFGIVGGLTANTTYEFFVRIDCGGGDFSAWTTTPYTARTLQSCPDVSAVTFSNVDQTQVDIAWTNGGTETAWSIEYGAPGFTPGTGTAVAATTNPFTLTGLASGTQYDICVTAVCAANDRSTPVCASILTPADYCNGDLFLDTGGATGDYQNNENITYNICPDNAGDVVYVNFTLNNMETSSNGCWDGLTIYDGPDTTFPTINTPAGGTQWCWNPATNTGTGNLVGELLIGTSTSGCITIVFSSDGSATRPGWSATVTCAPPPTCPVPSALSAANLTDSTATLSWLAGGTETAWEVEVGLPGFAPNTAATAIPVVSVATNPTTIVSGLTADTSYEYYVRAVCAAGDESIYRGPFAFKTECSPVVAPYTEDFETFTASLLVTEENCWKASSNSTTFTAWDWNLDDAGGTPTANTGPDAAFNGVKYFYVEGNGGAVGNIATLVSPLVNVTGLTNPSLQFNYHMFGAATGILRVDINDGTGFVNDVLVITGQQQTSGAAPWELAVIDLSGYASGAIQARFRAERTETGFSGTSDIALDNVVFGEAPACAQPSILVSTSVTDTTALLSWNENGSATSWIVEYGPCGFAPGTSAAGTTTVTASVNTGFSITGLASNTCYQFYVTADCSAGTLSGLGGPATFTTECSAFIAPYFVSFENFTPNTNFVGQNCWKANSDSAYDWNVDNSGSTPSSGTGPLAAFSGTTYVYIEASSGVIGNEARLLSPLVDITALTTPAIQFKYHMFGAQIGTLNVDVNDGTGWINGIGVLVGQQQTAQAQEWRDAIFDLTTVTLASNVIQVRLRATSNGTFAGDISVDDFRIDEIPTCPNISNLTNGVTNSSSVELNWTAVGSETEWFVEYREVGATAFTTVTPNPTATTTTINGLSSGTAFEFCVSAVCGVGDLSQQTCINASTTPDYCAGDLFLDTGGATGDYQNNENITYNICPDNAGDVVYVNFTLNNMETSSNGCWDGLTIYDGPDTTFPTINTPAGGTQWCWNPATNTGTGNLVGELLIGTSTSGCITIVFSSDGSATRPGWSANVTCAAAPTCPAPAAPSIGSITGNSVALSWVASGSASIWEVEVQPVGVAQGTPTPVYENTTTTNPEPITGLNPITAYSAYIRAACSPTDLSAWVGPINFTTACAVFPTPYSTPFAAIPGHNPTEFAGACWSEGNDTVITAGPNGANGAWGSDDFGNAVGGPNGLAARINIYDNASIDRDWLVTPEFNLGAAGHSLEASFTVALTVWNGTTASNFGSDDAVELLITADSGVTWTSIRTFNANSGITPAGLAVNVPLTAYSGTVRLAFWSTRGVVADPVDIDFFVDNFAITATAGVYSPDILGFTYYPNPTQGVVNFDAIQPISRIAVRNMLGQVIENIKVDALSMQINLATYATGMYLVEVTTAGRTNIVRIIKE